LRRKVDGPQLILSLAGTLFCLNAPLDLSNLNLIDRLARDRNKLTFMPVCTKPTLPTWMTSLGPIEYRESRVSKDFRTRAVLDHDVAGPKAPASRNLDPISANSCVLKIYRGQPMIG
jgi:hypothetical protein